MRERNTTHAHTPQIQQTNNRSECKPQMAHKQKTRKLSSETKNAPEHIERLVSLGNAKMSVTFMFENLLRIRIGQIQMPLFQQT